MNRTCRSFCLLILVIAVSACSTGKPTMKPAVVEKAGAEPLTIADLNTKTVTFEPDPNLVITRQKVIDSYRALVAISVNGGSGDDIRRLADLELDASLDNRASDDPVTVEQGRLETLNAINAYQRLLKHYPGRDDIDYILYQLSKAYAMVPDQENELLTLDRLAEEFPHTRYIDEVQFRRGEDLFILGDYQAAEKAYAVIVENHQQSLFYEKALYKHGWSLFKQNRYRNSLDIFINFLDVKASEEKIGDMSISETVGRAERELLDDVFRIISLTFSYSVEHFSLADYFGQSRHRSFEPLLYLKLGELYLRKKRLIDAATTFLSYGLAYPHSRYAPQFHQKAIDSYKAAGFYDEFVQEKIAFVNKFDVGTSFWAQQNATTQSALQPVLTQHMQELATHYHAQAQTSKNTTAYDQATRWYHRYLSSFPDDKGASEINFLLAETLFEAGQYEQAIVEYEKTAYQYKDHKRAAEAGYAALLAYDALFQIDGTRQDKKLLLKRVDSALAFSRQFASDPRAATVLLQSAQIFYDWKDYPAAIENALLLAEDKQYSTSVRESAWTIISHSYFESKIYDEAEEAYSTLLTLIDNNDKTLDNEIREQIAASIYHQGEQARAAADHLLAAKHFSRLANVVPTSPKRIVADFDAAAAYIELESWSQAIALLEAFRQNYPDETRWKLGVTEKLALAYDKHGDHALAAKEILTLSDSAESVERRKDLIWLAAQTYENAGEREAANNIYISYIKDYPFPLERSIELRNRVAGYYRESNDTKQLRHWLNEIIKADARGKSERSTRSKYLAAAARLELIQPVQRSFDELKLTVPLKKSLAKKKALMQESIKAYTAAIKYQVAEITTEATFQIAEIYHNFARSLLESQRPKGLSDEELEEYDLLLEDQAYPFEEKAIDIHLSNFRRIPKGTYDRSVKNSLGVLGQMMPYRYAKNEVADSYVDIR